MMKFRVRSRNEAGVTKFASQADVVACIPSHVCGMCSYILKLTEPELIASNN